MSISISDGEELWQKFLTRWPLECLESMTLQEYTKAGDPDCFTYGWLEQQTEKLGSIWGGSAFKFGIYSRKNKIDKENGAGLSYSREYGWYSKYGSTPEEAFSRVRKILCEVATFARAGNLEGIEKADLGFAIKWKIAFLYQNQLVPTVVPVYSASHLAIYLGQKSKKNIAGLHKDTMARRGDANVLAFGAAVWEEAERKLSALALKSEDALAYFQENPERFQQIKEPSQKIAGFTTISGRCLAVSLELKEAKLWLEPGEWQEKMKGKLKNVEVYSADRSRNSNLGANAPSLALGNPAIYVTVPTQAALLSLSDAYDNSETSEKTFMPDKLPDSTTENLPLNQILYGPPGTGKTYSTIDEALRILDPEFLNDNVDDRTALKKKFDSFAESERIRFVTFHQSFSYEDFVEGLRAVTNDDNYLEYLIEPGVFKRICDDARTQAVQPEIGISNNPRIWKISINGTGSSPTKDYCLDHGEARIGWGETGDLRGPFEQSDYYKSLNSGNKGTLQYFSEEIAPGDILLCIHSAEKIGAIGVVTGDYRYEANVPPGVIDSYNHIRPVNWLYRNLQLSILSLNDGKQFTLKTVYKMYRLTWGDLLAHLEKSEAKPVKQIAVSSERKPHVLIIDEINRGNISRIFGELITLIEPSKRAGTAEVLSVTLPYSKKPFSVPSNVYLIGTMNTADRSLAGLDIALRRRFTFKELAPKPETLDGVEVDGLNIGKLLRRMNERIEVLLDRDHCLGHAYFIPLKQRNDLANLKFIFRQQILPLLQEYFFEDWERIAWVLNDQNKEEGRAFLCKASSNFNALFGANVANDLKSVDKRWRINEAAFDTIESYQGILGDAQ